MTTKPLGKNSAPKTVVKKFYSDTTSSVSKNKKKEVIVSDSESVEEAFFQDSDDAEMDWSEADSEEVDTDQDSASEDNSEQELDEEFDSEQEEEFIDDSEDEFVDDSQNDEIEGDEMSASETESVDSEAAVNLKEKDLIVPSAVSHSSNPLLQFFWKLADSNKTIRIEAVSGLIEHIKVSQAAFTAPVEISKIDKILSLYDSGSLSSSCCSDLTYSVKRLIKGLASSRDNSRLGFMLALLTVYHTFSDFLNPEIILTWSMKLTSPEALGGSVKRREERLLYVARIFALGALFRSNLGTSLSSESKKFAIDALISVGKKKSFLRESAVEVIVCACDESELAAYTFKKMASSSALMTETLAFAIIATSRFSLALEKSEEASIFSEFSDLKNLLARSNEEFLLNLLKETPCFENRLHTIWDLVLASLDQAGNFTSEEFLNKIIESMYLNSTGLVKRWTGLNLLKRVVELNKSSSIGFIFTPVILRMIKGSIGTLNSKSSVMAGKEVAAFNSAVVHFFRDLIVFAVNDKNSSSEIVIDLILHLSKIPTGIAGKNLLEELAGDNSVIAKLYLSLSSANVVFLIDTITKDISLEFDSQNQSLASYQAPFDKLIGLVKNEKLVKLESSANWINHLVSVMAKYCVESTGLKDELHEVVKGRFYSLLNELTDSKRFSGMNWIESISKMFLDAANGSKTAQFRVNIDEPTSDALENLKNIETLLKKQKIEPERLSQAIISLKNFLAIFLFLDPVEAIPVCSELSECLDAHFSSKSSKRDKTQSSLEGVILVLVEILVTFLSKPSQLTRKMCDDIFRSIIPYLTIESLTVLFQILKSVDSGKDEIFEEFDNGMSSDVESEEESEETSGNTIEAIDQAMKSTEGTESELSDVDDDQMMAFDHKLAEIFSEKRKALSGSTSSKARIQENKRTMVQFKFKVLEIVNLAFKSGDLPVKVRIASINDLLEIIFTNLSLNGSSSNSEQKQFFSKLEDFFTEIFGRPTRNPTQDDAITAEALICDIIERICKKDSSLIHAAVLPRTAQCVWYLIKICRSLKADESNIKNQFAKVVKFAVAPEECRFRVFRSFVFTWSNWDLHYIAPLLSTMTGELKALFAIGGIRPYQRNQVFEFFISLIKRAQSFNEKESAMKLLDFFSHLFSEIYTPVLSENLKKMRVDFFKDDLKFILFCSKKHREFDNEIGSVAWSAVLTTGLSNVEEFWKSQPNPNNLIKSFIGLLKSAKQ